MRVGSDLPFLSLPARTDLFGRSSRTTAISAATSMTPADILLVLTKHGFITIHKSVGSSKTNGGPLPASLPSSQHPSNGKSVARRALAQNTTLQPNPHSPPTPSTDVDKVAASLFIPAEYSIAWDRDKVEAHLDKFESKGWMKIRPEMLKWSPFLVDRAARKTILGGNGGEADVGGAGGAAEQVVSGALFEGMEKGRPLKRSKMGKV